MLISTNTPSYSPKRSTTVSIFILPDLTIRATGSLLTQSFNSEFFGGALGNDRILQEPMIRAHLAAALVPGEGEVHVAELPDAGVVGVAVW